MNIAYQTLQATVKELKRRIEKTTAILEGNRELFRPGFDIDRAIETLSTEITRWRQAA